MAENTHRMNGKICMVTGAASGIGAVTARALAQQGASVVLVDINVEKGNATAREIQAQTGNPSVEFVEADLSSQNDIRLLARQFLARHQRLDVLVNNAGAMFAERQESVDGIEMTFALNYLGYFLLTNLLLDAIKSSTPARIVNVASRSHARAKIDFEDMNFRSGYTGLRAYERSKLAIVLFTNELARRLQGTGVTANSLHPGVVATGFALNGGGSMGLITRLFRFGFLTPEQGAKTSIYLATSPKVEDVTGKYFVRCKSVRSSPGSYDEATANRLWRWSEERTNIRVVA